MRARIWAAALAAWGLCAGQLLADGVELVFQPPRIETPDLCKVEHSSTSITAYWAEWDQDTLGDLPSAEVKEAIRHLRFADAVTWRATIARMIDLLAAKDAAFAGQAEVLSRIALLKAIDDPGALREGRWIERLEVLNKGTSPSVLFILSEAYRKGEGVNSDSLKAQDYRIAAAAKGHPDALLSVAQALLDGQSFERWSLSASRTIERAFQSLVAKPNQGICGRAKRIARHYSNGDLVRQNPALAARWYQFAADLGDGPAAWQAYQMHAVSEVIEKDAELEMRYLKRAADIGIAQAQIELGRRYEQGVGLAKDLDMAWRYYRLAASGSKRAGLVRLILFLEANEAQFPNGATSYEDALDKLLSVDDPPVWALTKRVERDLDRDGRWSDPFGTVQRLQTAADAGDSGAQRRLAEYLLVQRDDPAKFQKAVQLLADALARKGGATTAKQLFEAHMCKAPDAPRLSEAQYWQAEVAAMDVALPKGKEEWRAEDLATLQAQALYKRPSAVLGWLERIEIKDAEGHAFWETYAEEQVQLRAVLSLLEKGLGQHAHFATMQSLVKEIFEREGQVHALALAKELIRAQNSARAENEFQNLQALSQKGYGRAMALLGALTALGEGKIAERYHDAITRDGDFFALTLAARYVRRDLAKLYLDRAIAIMPCDYKSARRIIVRSAMVRDWPRAAQFFEIAGHLRADKAWAHVDYADLALDYFGQSRAVLAAESYREAFELGSVSGARKLFDLYASPESVLYSPTEARAVLLESQRRRMPLLTVSLIEKIYALPTNHKATMAVPPLHTLYLESFKNLNDV